MRPQTQKEYLQIKVGAFIFVGIFLAMITIFILGSGSSLFQTQYTLYSYFEDISGLRTGSQVQLAGVKIGHVQEIKFEQVMVDSYGKPILLTKIKTPKNSSQKNDLQYKVLVKIKLSLDSKYQHRITEDSRVSVQTQGILGDQMVFITAGAPKADPISGKLTTSYLQDGEFLNTSEGDAGFQSVVNTSQSLLKEAGVILPEATKIMTQINLILKEIRTGKGLLHEVIYGEDSAKALKMANSVAANLDSVSKSVKDIVKKIDDGKGTIGAFINDPAIFDQLKTLLGKANRNKLVKSVIRHTLKTKEEDQ